MWYLFHGPNSLARDEDIGKMKAKLGEPDIASLNTTTLDRTATLNDIVAAADAMPFLAEKRLVVVVNWLSGLVRGKDKKAKSKSENADDSTTQLLNYLTNTSETTRLVFAEDDTLAETHPVVKLAQDKASSGHVKFFELPDNPVRWITERAKAKGSDISPQAATLLSTKINRGDKNDRDHFTTDSRTYLYKLDNELEKLAAYAMSRRIESGDIELLVKDEDIADIFKFIDAISLRNGEEAFKFVRGVLVRGESPLVVLSHLARQTRLLIQAKENEHLSSDAFAQLIGVHAFVGKKAMQQAGRFNLAELISAHEAVLNADIAIKTGLMDDVTALDVLVAAFCG
ncbi:MAG: DNA polymerase III subunit delta [Anaerolineae bacterium]|nr:DNA polymerase III subunit delta [Anaerolineae bacterium]